MPYEFVDFRNDIPAFSFKQVLSTLILFLLVSPLELNVEKSLHVLVESVHCVPLYVYNFVHRETVRRILPIVFAALMIEDTLLAYREMTAFTIVLAGVLMDKAL